MEARKIDRTPAELREAAIQNPEEIASESTVLGHTDQNRHLYTELSKRLIARKEEIIDLVNSARSNLDEQVMTAPGDAADESVIDSSADYFLMLANNHHRELIEIRDALDRMHKGVYGLCETCENPITMERLRRLPYARCCIECQYRHEKQNPLRSLSKI